MEEQIFVSDKKVKKQIKKERAAKLKLLQRSYKTCVQAWEAMNYQDLFFDVDLGMTPERFDKFQKEVVNTLSQICKIRQKKIYELLYSE